MAHLCEVLIVGLFAQSLCCVGCGRIGNGIFHIECYGLAEDVAGDVAILVAVFLAALLNGCGLLDGCKSCFVVKTIDTLYNGIGNNRYAGVTNHTVGLVAPQMPYREVALLVANVYHCGNEFAGLLGVYDSHQRLLCAVCVPERETGVAWLVAVVDLVVGTAVVAVHIAEKHWGYHSVVHCRVEYLLLLQVIYFNLYACKLVLPGLDSRCLYGFEIPIGELALKCQPGTVDAHRGDGYLEHNLLTGCCAERSTAVHILVSFQLKAVEWLFELHCKVYALVLCPAL